MPVAPTYPGVYIQEISSGVRTISGVATSITAFTAVRLKVEQNQLVGVFGEIGILFDALKGA